MRIKSVSYSYKYKKMRDLKIGDFVLGPDGEKHKILKINDLGIQDVYRITLTDGRSFESMNTHLSTVHFRNSHLRTSRKTYDTVTTQYIKDHLTEYLFEIPTDDTFTWEELDFPQFLEMLPLHEYEPIDENLIIPNLEKDPKKVYIKSIEKLNIQKECKCISLDYPWGLYLIENGICTHNSALANLTLTYIIVLFGLMRNPAKLLNKSQPVYEKVKLPDGKYTTIGDLKLGMKVAGVTQKESTVIDIIEQGEKDTYELTFENDLSCRCSLDHLWTVWDTTQNKYIVLPTKTIINDKEKYLFPEIDDCKRDKDLILAAEIKFFKERVLDFSKVI